MVKAQLENERYEKNMLEIEVKQNQDKADGLGKLIDDFDFKSSIFIKISFIF